MWSEKRRVALLLAAVVVVPLAVLTWLGAHLLQQDRDVERQRQREHLEVAAGRLALDIERLRGDRWPAGNPSGSRSAVARLVELDGERRQVLRPWCGDPRLRAPARRDGAARRRRSGSEDESDQWLDQYPSGWPSNCLRVRAQRVRSVGDRKSFLDPARQALMVRRSAKTTTASRATYRRHPPLSAARGTIRNDVEEMTSVTGRLAASGGPALGVRTPVEVPPQPSQHPRRRGHRSRS